MKYLVEFIGTFFLVLTITCVVLSITPENGLGNLAPIAIGSSLMVMIFAGGHISGAHYNPAVSLGAAIRGALPWAEMPIYWVAQIAGGAAAALLGTFLIGKTGGGNAADFNVTKALIAEIIGTFALVYVVLNTATSKGTEGNSFYGLAIGFTVTAMAYTLGGISGGAFNPAVAVGASLGGLFTWSNIWVYIVGNLVGAALAAIVFKAVSAVDRE